MTEPFHLDDIDRRLLRVLQENAGASHAAIAEQIGTSAASCWRRIRALEASGVLGPTVRLVNPCLVGRGVSVMCQIRMKSHGTIERQEFESFLQTCGAIMECYSMSGDWDYLLRVVVADVADYERLLMGQILNHSSVATASSHFALNQVKYTTAVPV
jgi:DNA-binding Lrp family transcriptional regulator